jgi:hypothetical protein
VDAGEVLLRNLSKVAGGRVGMDAVGDGLGAVLNADDGEAIKRAAGLVELVTGPRYRIMGDVTHGIPEECAPTWARMGVADRATRSP